MKDVGNSSRHGDDQEKTTKRSKMPKVNILLYLYFKSLCLFIFFFSVLVISLFLYCIDRKFHIIWFVFITFEAATQNNNHKTLFKIFKSTSERVNFLKRRLANIQSIFQKLGPGEQKSIILGQHFSEQSLLKTFQWLHLGILWNFIFKLLCAFIWRKTSRVWLY